MSEIKSDFRIELEKIKEEYEAERKRFNIFRALHKEHDEKNLHSRFISYLLSPTSKHGMGNLFLKLFIERLLKNFPNIENFNIDNCIVLPDEKYKNEHNYIDIYIQSEDKSQVIIIENKIFAGDSNDPKKDDTEEKIQLIRNYNSVLNDNKLKNYIKEIFVFYLTLDGHDPEDIEKIETIFPVLKIDYRTEIIDWIESCINSLEDNYLKKTLKQYKEVINILTNDVKRAKKLQKLISDNIDEALHEQDTRTFILEMEDFKHVKWHTIDEFWIELTKKLKDELKAEISKEINIKEITKVAHKGIGSTGINFKLENGEEWYIVNDKKNGLTYGNCGIEINDKKEDKNWFIAFKDENKRINITDFNIKETFMLINAEIRKEKINDIFGEIFKRINESKSIIL
ncbi:MAG: hypothetical protein H6Q16_207 [Bacteroidetes bacterium]|nr:hypothetical protein [Bacteroidota bacterium]